MVEKVKYMLDSVNRPGRPDRNVLYCISLLSYRISNQPLCLDLVDNEKRKKRGKRGKD